MDLYVSNMRTKKLASHRRLDDSYKHIIAALLRDVSNTHGVVFNGRMCRLTTKVIMRRISSEGASFLTKTLPRLGKSFDKALAEVTPMNAAEHRLTTMPHSQLPKLFGELFIRVLKQDGTVLQDPCPESIRVLRQLLFVYYKYELPYTEEQETQVESQFARTEVDLKSLVPVLNALGHHVDCLSSNVRTPWPYEKYGIPHLRSRKWRDTYSSYTYRGRTNPPTFSDLQWSLGYGGMGIREDDMAVEGPLERGIPSTVCHQCEYGPRAVSHRSQSCFARSVSDGNISDTLSYYIGVVRRARKLLRGALRDLRPLDIVPRHGPGSVATKQRLWSKYLWTNVSARITEMYPIDAYYFASLGHVCDRSSTKEPFKGIFGISDENLPARVILVPKDSRGPRLISSESVDHQWIQQGLGRAIVERIENNALTKYNVFFTDQQPNRFGALLGSQSGRYATLDLNEASDRVSVALVRLLFPDEVLPYLWACRSSSTKLRNGEELELQKFAPMGSALCFPILALTVWSLLTAVATDQDTADSILVFGDDVVVPTVFSGTAITILESFGLKINRDKSCVQGLFRESCGMDAYKGVDVTPIRLRTVWTSSQSPEVYESWIAYANSFFDRRYYATYWVIAEMLFRAYGPIPSRDCVQPTVLNGRCYWPCPVLATVPSEYLPHKKRWNRDFQKWETLVRVIVPDTVRRNIDGWSMLLRYFSERVGRDNIAIERIRENDPEHWNPPPVLTLEELLKAPQSKWDSGSFSPQSSFQVRTYTQRDAGILAYRWR